MKTLLVLRWNKI